MRCVMAPSRSCVNPGVLLSSCVKEEFKVANKSFTFS